MMAETVENGILDVAGGDGKHAPDISVNKRTPVQVEVPKQNGVSEHEDADLDEASRNGTEGSGESKEEKSEDEMEQSETDAKESAMSDTNENKKSEIAQAEDNNDADSKEVDKESANDSVSIKSAETPVVLSDNVESGEDAELVDENDSNSPVTVNTDDASEDSEVMEVGDDDSNVVEVDSNVSAPNSDVVEVDENNSHNPSVISEDSSRDSIDSASSAKTSESEESSDKKDGIVSTVKDEEGAEIMITLNDENEAESDEIKKDKDNKVEVNEEKTSEANKEDKKDDESVKSETEKSSSPEHTEVPKSTEALPKKQSVAPAPSTSVTVTFPVMTSSHLPVLKPGAMTAIPVGAQIIQQGQQLGYVTRVGNQSVFVPVSSVVSGAGKAFPAMANQLTMLQGVQKPLPSPSVIKTPLAPAMKLQEVVPKSSIEMIDRMKWEIQNRYPDNYNWSVAFHPKKEELSSITSFLLELGHDVVKEAVYKDIIQIQTKKNESGNLKENEIESLEKMKTVYENTKKKVEHLQLPKKRCDVCKFKTESSVVMNHHKDFPHCDPPFDLVRSWLGCAHCDFKTRVIAQFSFHMETVHKLQAKLPDKSPTYQCELCPLSTKTKSKLDKHRAKCVKHFKLNVNLQAYYHDVNFCMKTCYYKPKKPPAPKPPPPPPKPAPPPRPTMATRTNQLPQSVVMAQQAAPMHKAPVLTNQQQPQQKQQQQQTVAYMRAQQAAAQLRGGFTVSRPGLNPAPNLVVQRPPGPLQQRPVRPPGKEMSGFEVCELCGGYVKDRQALRIHFYYAHKVEMPQAIFNRPSPPLICDVCQSKFWTTQGLSKHKSTLRHYSTPATNHTVNANPGVNQQCFMCMRKVTNLFVHIEQIHGMTMKDLVAMKKCIMCGITAPDKRALEVHMASVHGVLIKANDFAAPEKPRPPGMPNLQRAPEPKVQPPPAPSVVGGKGVFRANVCVFCQIQFADNIQLTMHCMKIHATCTSCGMVVATSKHLANHNCKQMKRSCAICGLKNILPEAYAVHMNTHVKPCKVKITKMSEKEISQVKDKIKREYKPQVISLDSEEDSDVEVVENTKPSRTKPKVPKKIEESEIKTEENEKTEKKSENENTANSEEGKDKSKNEIDDVDKKDENTIKESDDTKSTDETVSNSEEKDTSASENLVKEKDKIEGNNELKDVEEEKHDEKESDETELKEENKLSTESTDDVMVESTDDKVESTDAKVESSDNVKETDTDESADLDDKLLAAEENSNDSQNSRKRKKSESDGDEDELLRDDSETKRQKVDDNSEKSVEENMCNKEKLNNENNETDNQNQSEDVNENGDLEKKDGSIPETDRQNVDTDRGVKRPLEEQEPIEQDDAEKPCVKIDQPAKRLKSEEEIENKNE